ncbi:nickel pincer cofactor biosynthesis protein LarC [Amycolatopsis sp. K13G38]|uniref:Pyridinium-3,5-bisthiocarboxylic acid mononucleotide nickel insertion protein n=1 Tax=Amycolatopsis acididurans TaxID=2724524 RepID=A0ABX1IZV4_9PSEU|nr:nickel pincer cofactor biosynthesis protein LarC [Amycolatopsis acididurans]NKQ52676.1 nickel pincer cofactor biosynthesis protein LarC [Amycolatopsis acididurans]
MQAWIDASAGIAGDMMLGALVDAGAPLPVLQAAVDAVVPGSILLTESEVTRAGTRARKVDPVSLVDSPPHRHWAAIRRMLTEAALPGPVADDALRVFGRLAEAEARVHGTTAEEVHFHEVGALDAIADVVGTCAALHELGVDRLTVSAIAVGSGTVRAAHGTLAVPVPAVVEMTRGWRIHAGGEGELATPTGVALVTALATDSGPLPEMRLRVAGTGAGSKDFPGRANVVRVLIAAPEDTGEAFVLETNVDDLDPRVWPGVLDKLLAAGASDAWLTPILMKKGRPAHTLHALVPAGLADTVADVVVAETSTFGLRRFAVRKTALDRRWFDVALDGGVVRIKVAHRDGRIVQATPEFEDAAALSRATGRPLNAVLHEANAAATARGLAAGAPLRD